jgi:hypothetical protein
MSTRQRNGHSKDDAEDSDEDTESVSLSESSYDAERAQPKLKKSQRWHLQTLIVVLVNFTLFFTLAFLFIYQKPVLVEITADETRLIDINPYLYKRIEFTDKTGELKTYLFSDLPSLTKQSRLTLQEDFTIPKDHYKYWARYFNSGSKAAFSLKWNKRHDVVYNANVRNPLEAPSLIFCLHKGDLNSWLSNGGCEIEIDTSDPLIKAEYRVATESSYYFIVENKGSMTDTPERLDKEVARLEADKPSYKSAEDSPIIGLNVGMQKRSELETTAGPKDTAARPAPFYFITGNVSFELTLLNYDVSAAIDLFDGSFIKDYDFGTSEWLVVSNPLKSQHLTFSYVLTLRISTLFMAMIVVELVLFCSYFVPLWLRKLCAKRSNSRQIGVGNVKTTDTSWYKSFREMHGNYFEKRQRSNIRVNVPKEPQD